ncbi:MAG: hypothetical protein HQL56_08205 [Magnetococcales bacterium]|nr:hypothetical protein [Magnetococcales bacterium]
MNWRNTHHYTGTNNTEKKCRRCIDGHKNHLGRTVCLRADHATKTGRPSIVVAGGKCEMFRPNQDFQGVLE